MTSLDDARQIIEAGPLSWHTATKEWICGFCCERLFDPTTDDEADATIYESFTHDPDCPWLSMTAIVEVIECAQRIAEAPSGDVWGDVQRLGELLG